MTTFKLPHTLIASMALTASFAFSTANAQTVVSGNFSADGSFELTSTDTAGAPSYESQNWNNLAGASGGPILLNDSTGSASPVTITTYSAGLGEYGPGGPNDTPQAILYGSGLQTNFGNSTFELTGLDAFSSYDIVVYYSGGTSFPSSRHMEVVASGSSDTYYVAGIGSVFTDYTQGTNVSSASYQSSNYVVFEGLTGATQTVSLNYVNNSVGLTGFQVVGTSIPEPGALSLLSGMAVIGVVFLWKRRKASRLS